MSTNSERIARAQDALFEYDEPGCEVIDLLADLMHFCHAEGVDFEDQLRIAEMHFDAEKDEE